MGMTYTVSVSEIPEAFHRAHSAVLKKLGGTGKVVALAEYAGVSHFEILEVAWIDTHCIKPLKDWKLLEFSSEQQYTFFMLRWS